MKSVICQRNLKRTMSLLQLHVKDLQESDSSYLRGRGVTLSKALACFNGFEVFHTAT